MENGQNLENQQPSQIILSKISLNFVPKCGQNIRIKPKSQSSALLRSARIVQRQHHLVRRCLRKSKFQSQRQIADGKAENKAEVVRRALTHFAEHQAVIDVLEAEQDVKEGRVYVYKDAESFEKHLREMYD
jgi:Arc/MetJ-type ribon-helix-helix transcriptional regulator